MSGLNGHPVHIEKGDAHAILPDESKRHAVRLFLKGESVTDVAAFFGIHKRAIEQTLREALVQLSELASPADQERITL